MNITTTESVLFSWSGGKDGAMALYELRRTGRYKVLALLTTLTEGYDRICMHGVREVLLEQQAACLGLSLSKVRIPKDSDMEEYEAEMQKILTHYQGLGISSVVFGDVFLEDLKEYRRAKLSQMGLGAIFPVWKRDTAELARTFIDMGFKAVITCVDTHAIDRAFAGRVFDRRFLRDITSGVDPCGENGEFHSFVYDGPIFKKSVPHEVGEIVMRDNRFCFCDLMPTQQDTLAIHDSRDIA